MDYKSYFINRCTVRKFKAQHIEDEMLAEMLEMASHAPTTGNMQLYSVVVTRSAEKKAAIAPAHFNQPSVTGCDVLLTICADFNRFERWCDVSGAVPGYNNFQSFVTALLDAALFAQQLCTIAEMRGLGCCYLGTTTYNAQAIAEMLALPDRVVPVTTLVLGYPEGEAVKSDRLPIEAIVHFEKYNDYTAETVKSLYAEKEARDDSKRFVAENDKTSLAQVFTDVRYTREANEHFSGLYRDFIESKGFVFPD